MLRILKITTPVKCVIPFYDGYFRQPEEGELHRRTARNTIIDKQDQPVWSLIIDKPNRMIRTSKSRSGGWTGRNNMHFSLHSDMINGCTSTKRHSQFRDRSVSDTSKTSPIP